jgi:hypothetical protein
VKRFPSGRRPARTSQRSGFRPPDCLLAVLMVTHDIEDAQAAGSCY